MAPILRPLRIALVSPPFLPLPPPGYAGTERIVTALAVGLHERGHSVTVFAPGDSELPCQIIPTTPRSLWSSGDPGDATGWLQMTAAKVSDASDQFDLIHSHIDADGLLIGRSTTTPFVATLHGRLDVAGVSDLIEALPEVPLISISDSQRRWNEGANWVATIHHGLDFAATPRSHVVGDYLLLVGRVMPEKGVAEAVEVARRTGIRLVMAAKVRHPDEVALFEAVVRPAIAEGVVDWRGEIGTAERDKLMAGARATLMLGGWPEPFGLVAIESMATGTPVIARRAGALVETVRHGRTGYLVDDVREAILAVSRVGSLPREPIAAYARSQFSVERMVDDHERAYERLLAAAPLDRPRPKAAARMPRRSTVRRREERAPRQAPSHVTPSVLPWGADGAASQGLKAQRKPDLRRQA
jgi:glycosyltransferase involved in cell wall biosynthesis